MLSMVKINPRPFHTEGIAQPYASAAAIPLRRREWMYNDSSYLFDTVSSNHWRGFSDVK